MALKLPQLIVMLTESSSVQQKIIQNYLNNLDVSKKLNGFNRGICAALHADPEIGSGHQFANLPDMSGADLLETIRNNKNQQDLPFR